MHALQLNFVERRGLVRILGILGLVGAILFCAFTAHRYTQLSTELEAWEANWRRGQKTVKERDQQTSIPKVERERLQAELQAANQVIARLALPWDTLFREVEGSVRGQVTLLSVEPDVGRREIKITAEAKDLSAMLEYLERLETAMLLRGPHITSHQVQRQEPQTPVRFVIEASWDTAYLTTK